MTSKIPSSSSSSLEIQNSSQAPCDLKISNSFQGGNLEWHRKFGNLQGPNNSQALSHNLPILNSVKMEADCEESSTMSNPTPDMSDITRLLASLSTQITTHNTKLSNEILQVVHTNYALKHEVCAEIDELRAIISDLKQSSESQFSSSGHIKKPSNLLANPSPTQGSVSQMTQDQNSNSAASLDNQSQLMLMFANSFSKFSDVLSDNQETLTKLSTALTDKFDSKSE